jgi:ribonuclease VapC
MFIDASAVIAILTFEPEKPALARRLAGAKEPVVSPISVFESVLGLRRIVECRIEDAKVAVDRFVEEVRAEVLALDAAIGAEAVMAHQRFGKGRHRAGLNMGDCFAYACAKVRGVPLLCKGDDFVHTDIEIA